MRKKLFKESTFVTKQMRRKDYMCLVFLLSGLFFFQTVFSQSYNYSSESFEENVWSNAPESSNPIASSTGTWTVRKNNIQTTEVTPQDGTYSLLIAEKTDVLMTPRLDNGAGVLTYYAMATGSRTVTVSTSPDQSNWTVVETYPMTSGWVQRSVTINDPAVRYIKFATNSNKGAYLDNILITMAGAPGVSTITDTPAAITQTSALVGGTITSDGSSTILSRGICYNSTGYPDTSSNKIVVAGTTGSFTGTISGLEMGTTYYVKAYASTNQGVSYGLSLAFTTREADAPLDYWTQPFEDLSHFPGTAPTSPLTINVPGQGDWIYLNAYKSTNPLYITDGSACDLRMLKNGSYVVTPVLNDGVTTLSFVEGRGERELTVYTSTDGGSSWSTFETFETVKAQYIHLKINSAGVNRIKIANNSGSDADIDNITINVYPQGVVPSLSTTAASAIGKNSASTGGNVTSAGDRSVEERGVCWSTTTTPIIADSITLDGSGTGTFTSLLSGLPAGTEIYVRAYARSRAGTGYGNEITFTTLPPTIPVVTTTSATDIKGELATSGGNITDGGGAPITQKGVCWNTSGNPTIADSKSDDGTGTGIYETMITNLTPNTFYYYRAYATNIAGTGYGDVDTFTTGSVALPSVTTSDVSDIYFYEATGNGNVTSDGGGLTYQGICWNTTGNPTIADDTIICGIGSGAYNGTMTGLNENTLYYVRAFATNSLGTVYGNEVTFATPVSTKLTKPVGYGEGTTGGGTPTPDNTIIVTTAAELAAAINGDKSIILVSGTISTSKISATITNKSIIGLPGAKLVNLNQTQSGSGILYLAEGSRNVIIQNLIFEGPGAYDCDGHDLLTNKGCNKLWVDHCEFQDGVDGCFDNTSASDSITASWCKFTYLKPPVPDGPGGSDDHRFACLVGGSDSDYPADGHYSITWQNCWWAQGCVARMIRGRNTEVHMLNCYWNSPDTKDAIGLTAGTNGSTVYVEGGVFDIPGDPADIGSGSISIHFTDCVDGGINVGTVDPPLYEYIPMASGEVISAVTTADCGAGATLIVTESGEVYSGCPATPILMCTNNLVQEVYTGNAISDIVFTWAGTATDVTLSGLPAGLSQSKDAVAQTLTISGVPTASGTFTVTTTGGSGLPASKQGTIMITDVPPPSLVSTDNTDQTVNFGDAITSIVFTWGGGATDVTASGLPKGLTTLKDTVSKTFTLSGKPSSTATYTITTIGGSGNAVSIDGTISILYTTTPFSIAYVTNNTQATYNNDIKILPALKADPNFSVTEINSGVSGNVYSSYDLVLFSEVVPSTDPGVAELEGINKPFIMMKVHSYKSDAGAWDWSGSSTAYGQNSAETNIVVSDKSHPIFKDVTWVNDNEVQVISQVGSLKGLTYMDPAQLKSVSGGTIASLANVKGQTAQVSIFEVPEGTSVAGNLLNNGFIQIGINSNSYANVTADGISIIKNACLYLLVDGPIVNTENFDVLTGISDFRCYPTLVEELITVCLHSGFDGNGIIRITDINGRIVHQELVCFNKGYHTFSINIVGKHPGLYILSFETNNVTIKQKLMIK
ncbi:MAG: T9SS type A sorting domain-containing protein [Bacteroidales bacterium]|nr:T9SS type A sorting domain-containing protein [Bacteroidales bacterium]